MQLPLMIEPTANKTANETLPLFARSGEAAPEA